MPFKPAPLALALLPLIAHAQQPPPPDAKSAFKAVLWSPDHQKSVLAAAKQSTVWQRNPCATATFTLQRVMIYRAPEFDPTGKPVSGLWGEKLRATGCGTTRTLNAMTTVRSPGVLVNLALAPGDTTADPILQHDAASYARPVALLGQTDCKDVYLENTEILHKTEPPPPQATGTVRFEKWTVFVCGSEVPVELSFTPDSTGTLVSAHAITN
jgi:hypothetical protein